jgi:uncharacterized protein (DUF2249 family)
MKMNEDFAELDVRPILRDGGEPFQAIMRAVDALRPGQGLKLFAPFRPQPLYAVMASSGFDHEVTQMADGDFEVRFLPQDLPDIRSSQDVEAPELWPNPVVEMDLTDLAPPEPLVRILSEAENRKQGEVIFALLSREPLLLFPELAKRGHQWVGNFDDSGAIYRIMIRIGKAEQ